MEKESVIYGGIRMAMGRTMVVFYANDGFIGLRENDLIQGFINVLIRLL